LRKPAKKGQTRNKALPVFLELSYWPPLFLGNLTRLSSFGEPCVDDKVKVPCGQQPPRLLPIVLLCQIGDTLLMDTGQLIYVLSRLSLGALAAFFSILLWSKTRDIAWMLMVMGTIAIYVETVYSILGLFGISSAGLVSIGTVPLLSIILPNLPVIFFISAFTVMIARKYRRR
jgi:hypothetical protein